MNARINTTFRALDDLIVTGSFNEERVVKIMADYELLRRPIQVRGNNVINGKNRIEARRRAGCRHVECQELS